MHKGKFVTFAYKFTVFETRRYIRHQRPCHRPACRQGLQHLGEDGIRCAARWQETKREPPAEITEIYNETDAVAL